MDWIIESDKNNGYPYHAELRDIYFEPVKSSPYPSELFILSGKGAYPKLQRLNFLSRIVLSPQYPTVIFRCLGENINDGYPVLMHLSEVGTEVQSSLYINEHNGRGLYYGDELLNVGICQEQKVYKIIYSK